MTLLGIQFIQNQMEYSEILNLSMFKNQKHECMYAWNVLNNFIIMIICRQMNLGKDYLPSFVNVKTNYCLLQSKIEYR